MMLSRFGAGLARIDEAFVKRRAMSSMRRLEREIAPGQRGLFVDCGGNDGCSAVKFILANPSWDCISFEPNPDMWRHYAHVPTTLFKSGVAAETAEFEFFVDHVHGSGSTILPGKTVVFGGGPENANVKSRSIYCVDLSEVIEAARGNYDRIILKLDVEGAEYDILEKLLETGALAHIDEVMCEWHWHKCDVPKERHDDIAGRTERHCPVKEWDALDFGVHERSGAFAQWRKELVAETLGDIDRYRQVRLKGIMETAGASIA